MATVLFLLLWSIIGILVFHMGWVDFLDEEDAPAWLYVLIMLCSGPAITIIATTIVILDWLNGEE